MNQLFQTLTAKFILSELRKIQKLPTSGFIAGGAVANTILSMIDNTKYPINDIDIFVTEDINNYWDKHLGKSYLTENHDYDYSFNHNTDFYVIRSIREHMLNYIFNYFHNQNDHLKYYKILTHFDMNCCQIGIDLETETLLYTPEFIEFIDTRILKIMPDGFNNPAATAIRVIKKADELRAFFDPRNIFIPISTQLQQMNNISHINKFFGTKYKDLFYKYHFELSPYFILTSFLEYNMMLRKNNSYSFNPINKELYNKWKSTKLWTLKSLI